MANEIGGCGKKMVNYVKRENVDMVSEELSNKRLHHFPISLENSISAFTLASEVFEEKELEKIWDIFNCIIKQFPDETQKEASAINYTDRIAEDIRELKKSEHWKCIRMFFIELQQIPPYANEMRPTCHLGRSC